MTNEQKLAAVRQGLVGSYNLVPYNTSMAELTAFQSLAYEAHRLAADNGYFCRREIEVVEGGRFLRGVLVTIPRDAAAARQALANSGFATPPRWAIESQQDGLSVEPVQP